MQLFSSLVYLSPGPVTQNLCILKLLPREVEAGVRAVKSRERPRLPDGCCITQPFYVNCLVPTSECLYHGLCNGKGAPTEELRSPQLLVWADSGSENDLGKDPQDSGRDQMASQGPFELCVSW